MKLIVGLGNPGRKYQGTRHNVGFVVLDKLAAELAAAKPRIKFHGEVTEGTWGTQKFVLLWPHTFMNASGRSVRQAVDFYKTHTADLMVVCDDLNLPVGRLRVRPSGSAGGQKGLADIIRMLGSEDFPRLRIGIDRPPAGWETADYVLGRFGADDQATMEAMTDRAVVALKDWAQQDIQTIMSRFNAATNE